MTDTVYSSAYIFGAIIGSLVMGFIIGLPPFIWGRKKGHKTVAIISMLLCELGQFINGLLFSVPICIVALIVIALLQNKTRTSQNIIQNTYQNNNQQAINADSRNCPHCGTQIESGEVYCSNCGRKI